MIQSSFNILIVEDNRVNQLLAKSTLLGFGFPNCDIAETGMAALEMTTENQYDLILLDIQMPGMDGYEIATQIRSKAETRYQTIPIIALTADNLKKDFTRAKHAGINDYLIKPYSTEDLYEVIRKQLKKSDERFSKENMAKIDQPETKYSKQENSGMDLSFLEKYTGGDSGIAIQLLEIFLREVPIAITALQQFIANEKWKDVHFTSHKVKSNFAVFELTELKNITIEIEDASRDLENLEIIPELFEQFRIHCNRILPNLKEKLRSLKETESR